MEVVIIVLIVVVFLLALGLGAVIIWLHPYVSQTLQRTYPQHVNPKQHRIPIDPVKHPSTTTPSTTTTSTTPSVPSPTKVHTDVPEASHTYTLNTPLTDTYTKLSFHLPCEQFTPVVSRKFNGDIYVDNVSTGINMSRGGTFGGQVNIVCYDTLDAPYPLTFELAGNISSQQEQPNVPYVVTSHDFSVSLSGLKKIEITLPATLQFVSGFHVDEYAVQIKSHWHNQITIGTSSMPLEIS